MIVRAQSLTTVELAVVRESAVVLFCGEIAVNSVANGKFVFSREISEWFHLNLYLYKHFFGFWGDNLAV